MLRHLWMVLCAFLRECSIKRIRAARLAQKELDRPLCVSKRQRRRLLKQLPLLSENIRYSVVRHLLNNFHGWEEFRTRENILSALRTLPRRDQDKLIKEEYLVSLDLSNPNETIQMLYEMYGDQLPAPLVSALYHDATDCVMTYGMYEIIWAQPKFEREQITHAIAKAGWLSAIQTLFSPMSPRLGIDMEAHLKEHVGLCLSRYTLNTVYVSQTIQGNEHVALEAAIMLRNWEFLGNLIAYLHSHQNDPLYNNGSFPGLIDKAVLALYRAGHMQTGSSVDVSVPVT